MTSLETKLLQVGEKANLARSLTGSKEKKGNCFIPSSMWVFA